MQKFIDRNNGINNVYAGVYSENFVVDKIFWDFDYGPNVLADTQKLYKWCLDNELQAIPIISGKKGTHLYIILHPHLYKAKTKILLTKATFSILKSVFGPFKQIMHPNRNGKLVRKLRTEDRIIGPDPAVMGDTKRISRIPNTLRPPENINYCTYLPPETFLDMTTQDCSEHMKSTHHYDYKIDFNKAPLLTDFEYKFDDVDFQKWETIKGTNTISIGTSNPNLFLKNLLRPCLYRHITSIHPSQPVRVAVTIDLLLANYSVEEIDSIYSTLGWEDYLQKKDIEQIKSCKKYTEPFSCRKLRDYGIPKFCCVC